LPYHFNLIFPQILPSRDQHMYLLRPAAEGHGATMGIVVGFDRSPTFCPIRYSVEGPEENEQP